MLTGGGSARLRVVADERFHGRLAGAPGDEHRSLMQVAYGKRAEILLLTPERVEFGLVGVFQSQGL